MLNSINTNIAAYSAQGNIGKASNSAASSIARLSSGNRIVKASDDVAALSIGTSLRTGVTTLKQALANTSQGTSLLQVADSALSQVSEILQRQKAIATQANSGTLSDVERGYLNQEFQALRAQIDQIASSTNFSSVTLLNGSLAGTVGGVTNIQDSAQTTSGSGVVMTIAGAGTNNDKISINGVEITFTTGTVGTADAAGKVKLGATVTETASNLVDFLNRSTDARLANYYFSNAAGAVSASWAGGVLQGSTTIAGAVVTAGTPAHFTAATATIAATNPVDGLGIDRTRAVGVVSGSLFVDGGTGAANAGFAVDTKLVEDNAAFVGKLGQGALGLIKGTYTADEEVTFSLQVGDILYTAAVTDIVDADAIELNFVGKDGANLAAGGEFSLWLKGGALAATDVDSQADVDSIVAQMNQALSGVSFVQNRDMTTFQDGEIVKVGGKEVGRLDGMSVNYRSDNFGRIDMGALKITAPGVGETDAKFEMIINGETFRSSVGVGSLITQNKAIVLQSTTNPNNVISFVTGNNIYAGGGTNTLDLTTQENADAIAAAINQALGMDKAGSALNFQVGATATDTIGVKISNVGTASLYNGANPDITTLAGAQAAAGVLDQAITTINQVRADVGALMSRLDFTAANLQSSIQNQDAARGTLLDTDVAAESTAYATAQVQLQAGIAVLAQANQLPQNLLKLIS